MIMGPLLLEFGMLPASTSATSATTVLVTSAAATAQFLIRETLLFDYGLAFGALGLVATFVGQTLLTYLVKKYQTTSFIVFSIAAVMVLAVLLMTLVGVQEIQAEVASGRLGFAPLCDAPPPLGDDVARRRLACIYC